MFRTATAMILAAGFAAPVAFAEPGLKTASLGTTKRLEFRYPDQPAIAYGSDGVHRQAEHAPLAFRSETSAISVADARAISNARPSMSEAQGFRIQVGAFGTFANADGQMARLSKLGETRIEHAEVGGRDLYRVFLFSGASEKAALETLETLNRMGIEGFILR